MVTVYKYKLPSSCEFAITMHAGAEVLHVGLDPVGALCAWAKVDTSGPLAERRFHIVRTGHSIPDHEQLRYIDSLVSGSLVWHVFEKGSA